MHFFKLATVTLPTLALVNATRLSAPPYYNLLAALATKADLSANCQVERREGVSSNLSLYCNAQDQLDNSNSGLTILNCSGVDVDHYIGNRTMIFANTILLTAAANMSQPNDTAVKRQDGLAWMTQTVSSCQATVTVFPDHCTTPNVALPFPTTTSSITLKPSWYSSTTSSNLSVALTSPVMSSTPTAMTSPSMSSATTTVTESSSHLKENTMSASAPFAVSTTNGAPSSHQNLRVILVVLTGCIVFYSFC